MECESLALSNPAFNNPAFQDPQAVQVLPPAAAGCRLRRAQTQSAPRSTRARMPPLNAQLEGMYAAPPAGAIETDRMTVEDTVWKTVGLFAILLVTAAVGWVWTMSTCHRRRTRSPNMLPWIVGALGGFVLAMVIFVTSRKKVRPALIFAYAAFEGLFVGGISAFFEVLYPGIVLQATLATLSVVGVTLALFASGKIRASKKATKIFMIAMIGYLVFSLLNVVPDARPASSIAGGGLRPATAAKIFGIPLGLIIGVLVVIMAAYSLVLDFDQIQQGVRNGAPRSTAGSVPSASWSRSSGCTSRSCASSRSCEAVTSRSFHREPGASSDTPGFRHPTPACLVTDRAFRQAFCSERNHSGATSVRLIVSACQNNQRRSSRCRRSAPCRAPEPLWRDVLGEQLRRLRHDRGERLADTADRAGVSPQYLSEMERGLKEPSSEMIAAVAGALEITLVDLTAAVVDELRERTAERVAVSNQVGLSLAA